jgi:hypothetical protein
LQSNGSTFLQRPWPGTTFFDPVRVEAGDEHAHGHAGGTADDQGPPAEGLQHVRVHDRHEEAHPADQDGREVGVHVAAHLLEEGDRVEEGDVDAGELLEDEQPQKDQQRLVPGGLEELFDLRREPAAVQPALLLLLVLLDEVLELELGEGLVPVLDEGLVLVEPNQSLLGLLVAAFRHQPRGALGDEHDQDKRYQCVHVAHPRHGPPVQHPSLEVGQHHACSIGVKSVMEASQLTQRGVRRRERHQRTSHVGARDLSDVHHGGTGTPGWNHSRSTKATIINPLTCSESRDYPADDHHRDAPGGGDNNPPSHSRYHRQLDRIQATHAVHQEPASHPAHRDRDRDHTSYTPVKLIS